MTWKIYNKCQAISNDAYVHVDPKGNAVVVWRKKIKWSTFKAESVEDAVARVERAVTT